MLSCTVCVQVNLQPCVGFFSLYHPEKYPFTDTAQLFCPSLCMCNVHELEMKCRLQRLILSLYFFLIATTISRLIIYAFPLIFISTSTLYSLSPTITIYSLLLMCLLHIIILNLLTCLLQVFRSACYGSDCQLWDSSLGSRENRQRHSAWHPPLRSHCLPCSYHTHTPLHFYIFDII